MSDFAHHGPGVDRRSVLAELDIENGLLRADCAAAAAMRRSVSHAAIGSPARTNSPDVNIDSLHSGQHHIISSAGVDDQELSISSDRRRRKGPRHRPARRRSPRQASPGRRPAPSLHVRPARRKSSGSASPRPAGHAGPWRRERRSGLRAAPDRRPARLGPRLDSIRRPSSASRAAAAAPFARRLRCPAGR